MERLSSGQLTILEEFKKQVLITKEIPEYWNPKPLVNDQIDRLEARGFIACDRGRDGFSRLYRITQKGAVRIGMETCDSCNCLTHPDEAACIHCGSTKPWADR